MIGFKRVPKTVLECHLKYTTGERKTFQFRTTKITILKLGLKCQGTFDWENMSSVILKAWGFHFYISHIKLRKQVEVVASRSRRYGWITPFLGRANACLRVWYSDRISLAKLVDLVQIGWSRSKSGFFGFCIRWINTILILDLYGTTHWSLSKVSLSINIIVLGYNCTVNIWTEPGWASFWTEPVLQKLVDFGPDLLMPV